MSDLVANSISRYHEKQAGNFITDWLKKNIKLPSKEKAMKVLRDNIKSEADVEELYKSIPKMVELLKSKKAAEDPLFPPGFVKNLAVLAAMLAILGNMQSKERAVDKLKDLKVIQTEQRVVEKVNKNDITGAFQVTKEILKKLKGDHSQEDINKTLIDGIKKTPKQLLPRGLAKIDQVKFPLELKFSLDKHGTDRLYPGDVNKLKEGDYVFVHREYTTERMQQIEDNLAQIQKEHKDKKRL